MKENVFSQWVERYQPDPVLFVREVLGVDPDPWQVKFLGAIARGWNEHRCKQNMSGVAEALVSFSLPTCPALRRRLCRRETCAGLAHRYRTAPARGI